MSRSPSISNRMVRRRLISQSLLLAWALGSGFWIGRQPAFAAPVNEADVVVETDTTQPRTLDSEEDSVATEDEADTGIAELSVPLSHDVTYPDHRPDWLGEKTSSLDSTRRIVVTKPQESPELAREKLGYQLQAEVKVYAESLYPDAATVDTWEISDQWICAQLLAEVYEGTVEHSIDGTLHEAGALLVIDRDAIEFLQRQANEHTVRERLVGLGGLTAGAVVCLVCGTGLFGMLSRYTNRRNTRSER